MFQIADVAGLFFNVDQHRIPAALKAADYISTHYASPGAEPITVADVSAAVGVAADDVLLANRVLQDIVWDGATADAKTWLIKFDGPCPSCTGKGTVNAEDCPSCNGTGRTLTNGRVV